MNEENLNNFEQFEKQQLIIKVTGQVVSSNLAEFEQQALTVLSSINTKLETDEDFAEAEQNVKDCQLIENRICQARNDALNNTADIAALIQTTERLEGKYREMRLLLTRNVKTEKERRKNDIINGAKVILQGLVLQSPVKHGFQIDLKAIQEAIKGKRFIAKMQEAVDAVIETETLRLAEMETNFLANSDRIEFSEKEWPGLFPDRNTVALGLPETVTALIAGRVADHRLKMEAKARKEREDAERRAATVLPPVKSDFKPPMPPPSFCDPFSDIPAPPPTIKTIRLNVTGSTDSTTLIYALSRIPGVIEVTEG